MRHCALIGIGSNMGDKLANCENAIAGINDGESTTVTRRSFFYKTEPMYVTDQDWFVNAAIEVMTVLEPEALLDVLESVQKRAGRNLGGIRFGPRPLDLDILFYDNWVIQTKRLAIPHPRLHERRFVLQPLCDICPDWVHPVFKKDMKSLLDALEKHLGQTVVRL
jgi:2-amino-4-hydroxy-6-hydroxymethyldihydropteridine diphosphokinase